MGNRVTVVLCTLAVGALVMAGQAIAQETRPVGAAVKAVTSVPASEPAGKGVQLLPDEKGKPFAVVERAKKAPAIDGKIEPEVWGEKPTLSNFYDDETGKPVAKNVQTQVWLLYDDEKLYIAAKMLEPDMAELQATVAEHDGNVWQDDDIEIFLDPSKKKDPSDYFQLAINPLGTIADQRGAPDVSGDTAWDCKGCTVKTARGEKEWTVEMAIPLKALGVNKPLSGRHWGVNFARDRKAGAAEKSNWANMGPQWHQPDLFAHVAFE
jgi:hypothetical protein